MTPVPTPSPPDAQSPLFFVSPPRHQTTHQTQCNEENDDEERHGSTAAPNRLLPMEQMYICSTRVSYLRYYPQQATLPVPVASVVPGGNDSIFPGYDLHQKDVFEDNQKRSATLFNSVETQTSPHDGTFEHDIALPLHNSVPSNSTRHAREYSNTSENIGKLGDTEKTFRVNETNLRSSSSLEKVNCNASGNIKEKIPNKFYLYRGDVSKQNSSCSKFRIDMNSDSAKNPSVFPSTNRYNSKEENSQLFREDNSCFQTTELGVPENLFASRQVNSGSQTDSCNEYHFEDLSNVSPAGVINSDLNSYKMLLNNQFPEPLSINGHLSVKRGTSPIIIDSNHYDVMPRENIAIQVEPADENSTDGSKQLYFPHENKENIPFQIIETNAKSSPFLNTIVRSHRQTKMNKLCSNELLSPKNTKPIATSISTKLDHSNLFCNLSKAENVKQDEYKFNNLPTIKKFEYDKLPEKVFIEESESYKSGRATRLTETDVFNNAREIRTLMNVSQDLQVPSLRIHPEHKSTISGSEINFKDSGMYDTNHLSGTDICLSQLYSPYSNSIVSLDGSEYCDDSVIPEFISNSSPKFISQENEKQFAGSFPPRLENYISNSDVNRFSESVSDEYCNKAAKPIRLSESVSDKYCNKAAKPNPNNELSYTIPLSKSFNSLTRCLSNKIKSSPLCVGHYRNSKDIECSTNKLNSSSSSDKFQSSFTSINSSDSFTQIYPISPVEKFTQRTHSASHIEKFNSCQNLIKEPFWKSHSPFHVSQYKSRPPPLFENIVLFDKKSQSIDKLSETSTTSPKHQFHSKYQSQQKYPLSNDSSESSLNSPFGRQSSPYLRDTPSPSASVSLSPSLIQGPCPSPIPAYYPRPLTSPLISASVEDLGIGRPDPKACVVSAVMQHLFRDMLLLWCRQNQAVRSIGQTDTGGHQDVLYFFRD